MSTIYTRLELGQSEFKWVKNASARFEANPSPPDPSILNFAEIFNNVCEPVKIDYDYKRLSEHSELKLGASCQTISTKDVWKNPENDSEYLFTFKCSETQEDLDRFIIHPWITDAALQVQGFLLAHLAEMGTAKLMVPVQIEKFVWWGRSAQSGYIFTKLGNNYNESHIYDDTGLLIASLLGIEIMQTSLQNIMALINSQRSLYHGGMHLERKHGTRGEANFR